MRCVIVGTDALGRSTIVSDGGDLPRIELPNGIVRQELWWQPRIPVHAGDTGQHDEDTGAAPPAAGAVVRILTVPPSRQAPEEWKADLHFDDALHIMTQILGQLDVVLEDGEVTLRVGESIVLPGSVHDLRNTTDEPATFVYTSFPLVR